MSAKRNTHRRPKNRTRTKPHRNQHPRRTHLPRRRPPSLARRPRILLRNVPLHPAHPPPSTHCSKANQKPKASLLRLHEQHQHIQHLPLHPPTRPLQRELHRLDLQRIHLPDLPVRYFHRSSLRCQRAAGAGVCGECVDDGEYYADGGLHRWVSSNLPFHFEAVPFANCAYKNSGIFSSSLVF